MPFPPPIVFLVFQLLVLFAADRVPADMASLANPAFLGAQIGWVLAVMRKVDSMAGRKARLSSFSSSFGRTFWLMGIVLGCGSYIWLQLNAAMAAEESPASLQLDVHAALWMFTVLLLFIVQDLCARDFCEVELASTRIKRNRFVTTFSLSMPIMGALYIHYRMLGMQPYLGPVEPACNGENTSQPQQSAERDESLTAGPPPQIDPPVKPEGKR